MSPSIKNRTALKPYSDQPRRDHDGLKYQEPTPAIVVRSLEFVRFTAANEQRLQDGVAAVLDEWFPVVFTPEFILTKRDRPDFFDPRSGIVIEVKYRASGGSLTNVVSQLARYAEDERVRWIILATPSRRIASQIPSVLCDKPVSAVVLRTGL